MCNEEVCAFNVFNKTSKFVFSGTSPVSLISLSDVHRIFSTSRMRRSISEGNADNTVCRIDGQSFTDCGSLKVNDNVVFTQIPLGVGMC